MAKSNKAQTTKGVKGAVAQATTLGTALVAALATGQSLTPPSVSGQVIDLLGLLNNKETYFRADLMVDAITAEGKALEGWKVWAQAVHEAGIRTIMMPENAQAAGNPIIGACKDVIAQAKFSARELDLYRVGRSDLKKLNDDAKKLRETLIKRANATYNHCFGLLKEVEKQIDREYLISQGGTDNTVGDSAGPGELGNSKGAGGTTRNRGEIIGDTFTKWINIINKYESKTTLETEFLTMMTSWVKDGRCKAMVGK